VDFFEVFELMKDGRKFYRPVHRELYSVDYLFLGIADDGLPSLFAQYENSNTGKWEIEGEDVFSPDWIEFQTEKNQEECGDGSTPAYIERVEKIDTGDGVIEMKVTLSDPDQRLSGPDIELFAGQTILLRRR